MTDQEKKEVEEYINLTIQTTIKELKRNSIVGEPKEHIYKQISKELVDYYEKGQNSTKITEALELLKNDAYFDIIPLYYNLRHTIEMIAEAFNVDTSTIVRNKKRLCLEIYVLI